MCELFHYYKFTQFLTTNTLINKWMMNKIVCFGFEIIESHMKIILSVILS